MRDEVKYILGMIIAGASLVAYAHATFASKSTVEVMDQRIYEIWQVIAKDRK